MKVVNTPRIRYLELRRQWLALPASAHDRGRLGELLSAWWRELSDEDRRLLDQDPPHE